MPRRRNSYRVYQLSQIPGTRNKAWYKKGFTAGKSGRYADAYEAGDAKGLPASSSVGSTVEAREYFYGGFIDGEAARAGKNPRRATRRRKATRRRNSGGPPAGYKWDGTGQTGFKRGYKTLTAANRELAKKESQGWRGAVNNIGGLYWVRLRADSFMDEFENPRPRRRVARRPNSAKWTMAAIKRANTQAGYYFFAPDNMKFAGSTVYPTVYQGPGGVLFVTRELPPHGDPIYNIRKFDPDTSRVTTYGSGHYNDRDAAKDEAKWSAKGGSKANTRRHNGEAQPTLAQVEAADRAGFQTGRAFDRIPSTTVMTSEFRAWVNTAYPGSKPSVKRHLRQMFFRAIRSGAGRARNPQGMSRQARRTRKRVARSLGYKYTPHVTDWKKEAYQTRSTIARRTKRGGAGPRTANPSLREHLTGGMKTYTIRLGGLEMTIRAKTKAAAMAEARRYVRRAA